MRTHVDLVAWFHIALSALGLLGGMVAALALAGAGVLSGELEGFLVTSTIAALVGGFVVLLAIPGLIGGIGLLRRASWARVLILIVALFELLHFPFGTALAVYTFWVMLQDETRRIFVRPRI